MSKLICVVDLGTTVTKAALVRPDGAIVALSKIPSPHPEGSEGRIDAEAFHAVACEAVAQIVSQAPENESVAGVALSSQRASLVALDQDDRPLGPGWSWQGTACEPAGERFFDAFGKARFRAVTGLLPSPIYAVAKIAHLRQHQPTLHRSARKFVLLHDYVLRRLGADDCYTDPSNASASGLWDTVRGRWSPEILDAVALHAQQLPTCVPAGSRAGALTPAAADRTGLDAGTPLFVGGGDQQCAVLGAGAVQIGTCVLTLGTAAVMLCPVDQPLNPEVGGVLCTSHLVPDRWVVEGFQSCFGSALRWAGSVLGTDGFDQLETLASRADPDASTPLFVPWLCGIASPDFDARPRGAWLGVSLDHGRAELARAVFEGLAMESKRVVDRMQRAVAVQALRLVGGGAQGKLLPRLIADTLQIEVELVGEAETALIGAAAAGWTGAGHFADLETAAAALRQSVRARIRPTARRGQQRRRFEAYTRAVDALRVLGVERVGA